MVKSHYIVPRIIYRFLNWPCGVSVPTGPGWETATLLWFGETSGEIAN